MINANVRMYAPEEWGTLQKFSKFYSNTYNFNASGKRAVSGAANHFHKALILKTLASKLIQNLKIDDHELETHGYTNATNSHELSSVVESVLLELYSSIDCTRKVIKQIYSKHKGVADSTRKYFQNIKDGKIDPLFPEQLIKAVIEAEWYREFRIIRDELTHLDTGNCHRDRESGKVRYIHHGIHLDNNILIIKDIFEYLENLISNVNQFNGRVFSYLLSQLKDERIIQFCGMSNGRMYTRYVSPSEAIDFHGGVCDAKKWFDLDKNLTCIFAQECGAYKSSQNN